MKIALFQPWLKSKGGSERLVLEYIKHSKHDIDLYTWVYEPEKTFEDFEKVEIKSLGNLKVDPNSFMKRSLYLFTSFTSKIDLKNYDVFLVSLCALSELILLRNYLPNRTIAYCHTPLKAIHSKFDYIHYMKELNIVKKIIFKIFEKGYKLIEKITWKKFQYVFCNSSVVKRRIINSNLFPENKIDIIHPGIDITKFKNKNYENYFFYPSRFIEYKRQDKVIEAFNMLSKEYPEYKLILVGSIAREKYFNKVKEKAEKNENIEIKINVSENELLELYSNCLAVIFAAYEEDFGIVPLEGAACEKPLILEKYGGYLDILEKAPGKILIDCSNPKNIYEAMKKIIENKEYFIEISKENRKYVANCTWENFSRKLDEKIEELFT